MRTLVVCMLSASLAAPTAATNSLRRCRTEEGGVTICERELGSMLMDCVATAPYKEACQSSACASLCAWRENGSWHGRSGPLSLPPCHERCPAAAAAADAALALEGSASHHHARALGLTTSGSDWTNQTVKWYFPPQASVALLGGSYWAADATATGSTANHFRETVDRAIEHIESQVCRPCDV